MCIYLLNDISYLQITLTKSQLFLISKKYISANLICPFKYFYGRPRSIIYLRLHLYWKRNLPFKMFVAVIPNGLVYYARTFLSPPTHCHWRPKCRPRRVAFLTCGLCQVWPIYNPNFDSEGNLNPDKTILNVKHKSKIKPCVMTLLRIKQREYLERILTAIAYKTPATISEAGTLSPF